MCFRHCISELGSTAATCNVLTHSSSLRVFDRHGVQHIYFTIRHISVTDIWGFSLMNHHWSTILSGRLKITILNLLGKLLSLNSFWTWTSNEFKALEFFRFLFISKVLKFLFEMLSGCIRRKVSDCCFYFFFSVDHLLASDCWGIENWKFSPTH